MRLIDELHLDYPFADSRVLHGMLKLAASHRLQAHGHADWLSNMLRTDSYVEAVQEAIVRLSALET